MANEFVARKGLIIKSLTTGTTETEILVKDDTGLVKVRTLISLGGTSGTSGSSGSSGTSGPSGSSGTSGTSGSSGSSGTSGISVSGETSVEFYYDDITQTLHIPNIHLIGSTIIATNLPIADEDNGNRVIVSGDTFYLLTGLTAGSSGTSGTSGETGSAGTSGTSGETGSAGTSGTSGVGSELSVDANTGLGITTGTTGDTIYTIYNTMLDPTLAVPTTVGGITNGTTVSQLTGKTMVQLWNDLLFPTVEPTYTIPTITMTGVATQTLEAGSTYAPSISVYGDKNDTGIYTQLRILRNSSAIFTDTTLTESNITDIAAQFGYTDPNNPNHRYTISPTPYSESYVLPSGASASTTYQGDGNYNSGLVKKNNKGDDDTSAYALRLTTAPQLSGNTFTTTTYTITSIFPYFYGYSDTLPDVDSIASAISGGTASKVVSSASGTLSIPYNVTSKYIWFAYQNSYTTKTVWYRTELDQGSIDGTFITTVTTKTANSPNGYWNGITFKMHWSVYGTTQTTLEFRNS